MELRDYILILRKGWVLIAALTLVAVGAASVFSILQLVDADLRRPKVDEYMDIEGAVGLTDVLIDRAELSDVIQPWGKSHSPPLLPVTDTAILAKNVGGAIVIVAAGRTHKNQLAGAIHALRSVEAPISGVVVTMMPTRGPDSYGCNQYGYGQYGCGNTYGSEPAAPVASASLPRRARTDS